MYLRPSTLDEAVSALASSGGRIIAGGTDVLPALVDRVVTQRFIDITGLEELSGIVVGVDEARFGARATWTDVLRANLPPCFDGLKAAAREVGSVQIQNAGTIAGNICTASPAGDGVPLLLTLDAEVEIVSLAGRRRVPLAQFILGYRRTSLAPGEIVAAIIVPMTLRDGRSAFLKLGARRYLVISIAMAAAIVACDDQGRIVAARIAVGACSPVAQRLTLLEQELVGQPAVAATAELLAARHMDGLAPIDDGRATAAYRLDAAVTVVRRVLVACFPEVAHA